ncbi:hypothetical protein AVDCRST_MAG82-3013, partial [uncultured Rubrobacteraceae bacterium]
DGNAGSNQPGRATDEDPAHLRGRTAR